MSRFTITGPTDGPQGDRGPSELETRLDLVTDAVIRIGERQLEQERAEKREAHKREVIAGLKGILPTKKPDPVPAATATPSTRPRISYFKDGKRWNERRSSWVRINPRSYDSPVFLDNLGKVLEVGDPTGAPTVTEDGFIARGCACCGQAEIVRDKVKFGRHRGALCVSCHVAWSKPVIPPRGFEATGRFVSQRLAETGYLPGVKLERTIEVERGHSRTEELYLQTWQAYTWAYRIMESEHPETQEPMTTSFGYLSGPLTVEVPEEVTA